MTTKIKFLLLPLALLIFSFSALLVLSYRPLTEDKRLSVMDLNVALLHGASADIKLEIKEKLEQLQLLLPRIVKPAQAAAPAAALAGTVATVQPIVPGAPSAAAAAPATPGQPPSAGAQAAAPAPELVSDPAVFAGLSPRLPEELLGITFYRPQNGDYQPFQEYKNRELLKRKHLPDDVSSQIAQHNLALQANEDQPIRLVNRSVRLSGAMGAVDLAVITLVVRGTLLGEANKDIVIAVDLLQDFVIKRLQQSELAEVFFINRNGTILSHPSHSTTVQYAAQPFSHHIVETLRSGHLPRESLEMMVGNDPYYVSATETGFKDVFAVAQVKKADAFVVLRSLLQKAGLVALLALSASIFTGVLFTTRLVRKLGQLKAAADMVAAGTYDVKLDTRNMDEFGVVAESFLKMAEKLKQTFEGIGKTTAVENAAAAESAALGVLAEKMFPPRRKAAAPEKPQTPAVESAPTPAAPVASGSAPTPAAVTAAPPPAPASAPPPSTTGASPSSFLVPKPKVHDQPQFEEEQAWRDTFISGSRDFNQDPLPETPDEEAA